MSETTTLTTAVCGYLAQMEKNVDNLRNYTEQLAGNGWAKPKTVKAYRKALRRSERQLAHIRADPTANYKLWSEEQAKREEAGVIDSDVELCHKQFFEDGTCVTWWGGSDQHDGDCPQPAAVCYSCRRRWEAHR